MSLPEPLRVLIAPALGPMIAPMRPRVLVLAIVCCTMLPPRAASGDLDAPPDPLVQRAAQPTARLEPSPGGGPALLFVLYQGLLAGSRGTRCPMDPSCSRYARAAIGEHGPLVGLALAADRLARCGRDLHQYPLVRSPQGVARADSVP